jgi:hypothetical protein
MELIAECGHAAARVQPTRGHRAAFRVENSRVCRASARFPKFVIRGSTLMDEFRKAKGTSKHMILVPLFDLKFLIEFAAGGAGTSNRRH